METISVLILDDEIATLKGLEDAVILYDAYKFRFTYFENLKDAMDELNTNSKYDFAIVDLALRATQGEEGNQFIDHLIKKFNIYPIVYSGQPEKVTTNTKFISVLTRGEHNSKDILNLIIKLFSTGITSLLGENGSLQKHIIDFYWENLAKIYKSPDALIESEINSESLTRLYLNYLRDDLIVSDDGEIRLNVDELYIIPQNSKKADTGSIFKFEEAFFIVITPRCDVARTELFQLLKIGPLDDAIKQLKECRPAKQIIVHDKIAQGDSEKKHYLPKSTNFNGGFIDFLDIKTISSKELHEIPILGKVSDEMMRNIISRFSSFYARQGQPVYNGNIEKLINEARQ